MNSPPTEPQPIKLKPEPTRRDIRALIQDVIRNQRQKGMNCNIYTVQSRWDLVKKFKKVTIARKMKPGSKQWNAFERIYRKKYGSW